MSAADFRLAKALGNSLGDKRLDILRRIGESGSISSAARAAGVSYKAAWQAIETLTNLAGTALVDKAVGGSGGGGALLTPAGARLLAAAERLNEARAAVLAALAAEGRDAREGNEADSVWRGAGRRGQTGGKHTGARHPDEGGPGASDLAGGEGRGGDAGPAALALRTSMRNHLPCVVTGLRRSGALVEVTLSLADGTALRSRITRASAELLDLRRGLTVLALSKATAVTIAAAEAALAEAAAPSAAPALTARSARTPASTRSGGNRLAGTVARIARAGGGRAVEVSLGLASGLHLVGFADVGHGLRRGASAVAMIDDSAIVIALGN